jgi:hypothetical protein
LIQSEREGIDDNHGQAMINEIQEEEQEPFSADLMNRLDLFKQHH